eukprot:m.12742 g.12742  ORF g.12742 m.12742 type:complete len:377 (+) comp24267_c0_seq2:199-1329(+)
MADASLYLWTAIFLQSCRFGNAAQDQGVDIVDNSAHSVMSVAYIPSGKTLTLYCGTSQSGVSLSWEYTKNFQVYHLLKKTHESGFRLALTFDPSMDLNGSFICRTSKEGTDASSSKHIKVQVASWAIWSVYSSCMGSCPNPNGKKERSRQCIPPTDNGAYCKGSAKQSASCTMHCVSKSGSRSMPDSTPTPAGPVQNKGSGSNNSDPSNLVIVVAVSSALVGLLLCVAIIACWRRLHVEQRQARQHQDEENAARAMLLSMTDYDSGISADDYPDDPLLRQMAGPLPLGVSFPRAPSSFAEALQGPAPPPNPFFAPSPPPERNNQVEEEQANSQDQQNGSPPADEEYAHLKEGMTEDEMPAASLYGDTDDIPQVSIL